MNSLPLSPYVDLMSEKPFAVDFFSGLVALAGVEATGRSNEPVGIKVNGKEASRLARNAASS